MSSTEPGGNRNPSLALRSGDEDDTTDGVESSSEPLAGSPDTPSKSLRLTSRRSLHDSISASFLCPGSDSGDPNESREHVEDAILFSGPTLTRRRPSTNPMDASGAMNRLRISMVGHMGGSSLDDDGGGTERSLPFVPTLPHEGNECISSVNMSSSGDDHGLYCSHGNITADVDASNHHLFSDGWITRALGQIPAIALIGIFHLMIGVPFGVSYFPMQWTSSHGSGNGDATMDGDLPEGNFPIPGKEAFGIRLFLFSTMVGQIVFVVYSGFANPIGLQMVENIGFTKELATVAISHQGYGVDALATLMVMFGVASVLVGVVFYLLGRFQLGKIVYFFPTHVLIGLIGGIGILLCKTGLEVTIAEPLSISSVVHSWRLWTIIVALETLLRFMEWIACDSKGKPRFALLSPVFFCMITPLFYLALWICRIRASTADQAGYFFPPMVHEEDESGGGFGTPWDVWKVIDFSKVSLPAIIDSLPTMFALILFSLIHVPINIPAFALSTKVDVDMNQELIAHGYSNMLAGCCFGLQNYMAYTQSVLYDKSKGTGKVSGMVVAIVTGVLFFVGPTLATYVPRCMAGTLLLHVGIDLFLEGVYDSLEKFDWLEYFGIWLIVCIMSFYGMEAAMVAGGISAVSTYAVQSVTYLTPIRGTMPATTLRSSHWNRSHASEAILEKPSEGRNRILVVQLQGHLFFGNMAFLTSQVHALLKPAKPDAKHGASTLAPIAEVDNSAPLVLIMDCSLVLGIDSSAAHAIVKLKDLILKYYNIQLIVFVTGSKDGFPTEYKLREHLSPPATSQDFPAHCASEVTYLLEEKMHIRSIVCDSLDLALMEAEDALIARQNPTLVYEDNLIFAPLDKKENMTEEDERHECISCLKEICPLTMSDEDAKELFSCFKREEYQHHNQVWVQGDESDSLKLVVSGQLVAELENEAGTTEIVTRNNIVGELGLVNGDPRMSTLRVTSDKAVLYSMSRESFEILIESNPRVARYIDRICVKHLALRVQHVSNRIFETRCLPI